MQVYTSQFKKNNPGHDIKEKTLASSPTELNYDVTKNREVFHTFPHQLILVSKLLRKLLSYADT